MLLKFQTSLEYQCILWINMKHRHWFKFIPWINLLFRHSVMSNSLQPHELQHTRLPCPSLSLGVCSNSCPMSPVMLSNPLILYHLLLLLHSIFSSIRVFLQWVFSSYQVAKVLELQLQHQSFQLIFRVDFLYDWLVWLYYI